MHIISGLVIELQDFIGLYRSRANIAIKPIMIRVIPKSIPSYIRISTLAPLIQLGAASSRRRGIGMDILEVREYQPGDDYRRIEWKASARLGKLMVKELEHKSFRGAVIILALHNAFFLGKPSAFELLARMVTSLALSMAQLGMWIRIGIITDYGATATEKMYSRNIDDIYRTIASIVWPTRIYTYTSVNRVLRWYARTLVENSCREPCIALIFTDLLDELDVKYLSLLSRELTLRNHIVRVLVVGPKLLRFMSGTLSFTEFYEFRKELERLNRFTKLLGRIGVLITSTSLPLQVYLSFM
ncbi:MAG TPA: DUF58 domain-containing protein [Ignisphaera sp.]|nr:DUF58 domain-containing protein [Ignisphaera sp.]